MLEIIFPHKISGTPWRIGVHVATLLPPYFSYTISGTPWIIGVQLATRLQSPTL